MTNTTMLPCRRAVGRAVAQARIQSELSQRMLANIVNMSGPMMCNFETGQSTVSEFQCGPLIGALASRLGGNSPEITRLRATVALCLDLQAEPFWLASTPEMLRLQRRALRDELKLSKTATVVWPHIIPEHLRSVEPDEVAHPVNQTNTSLNVAIGELGLYRIGDVASVHRQAATMPWAHGKRVEVRVVPADTVWEHQFCGPVSIMTATSGQTFAHIDTGHIGIFFHRHGDIDTLEQWVLPMIQSSHAPN